MDSLEINQLIEKCKAEKTITKKQQLARLDILKSALFKTNHEKGYQKYIEQYKQIGQQLEKESNGEFILDEDISVTKSYLEKYIASLDILKYLNANGIEVPTFEMLVDYSGTINLNITTTPLAIGLYRIIEKIETIEKYQVQAIETELANVFGINLVSSYNYKCAVDGNQAAIIKEEKTLEQLEFDHTTALSKAESYDLYLGSTISEFAIEMINEVFRYYKKGNRKIELEKGRKIGG